MGSVGTAYNERKLRSLKVTHILTISECLPPKFPNEFEYKVVEIEDDQRAKLHLHFTECLDFIKAALDAGGTVLVHCFAGVSRSATITIAYVMKHLNKSLPEALEFVRNKRPWICPNPGFMAQLRGFSNYLQRDK